MKVLVAALVAGLLAAQAPSEPLMFGRQAAWLRPVDVEAIARAVAGYGGRPWLLSGVQRSPLSRDGQYEWTLSAYVAPTTATPDLRRGPLVRVRSSRSAEQLADPTTWTADPSSLMTWAQVALPGRSFEDVKSEQDENRPLAITGDITDADLVSVVRFLRTGPVLSVPPSLNLGQVPGPVRGIRAPAIRHPALPAVRVTLGLSGGCGYDVVLERRGDTWTGSVEGGVGCADSVSSNPTVPPQR